MFNLLLNGSRSLAGTMVEVGQHESRVKLWSQVRVYRSMRQLTLVLILNLLGKPMRLSLLYYFGLEGLGSLDWESERNEDVRMSQELQPKFQCFIQGVIGPVHLSGSTPDLGNFKIRIEDGELNITPPKCL